MAAVLVGTTVLAAAWLSHRYFIDSNPAPILQASISKAPESPQPPLILTVPVEKAQVSKSSVITQAETGKLQKELNKASARYEQLSVTASEVQQQLVATQAQVQETSRERDVLRQQLAQAQAKLQAIQTETAAINSAAQGQAVRLVNLQATVNVLNASLDEKNRTLAVDEQFLDHDREIRNLIAARNLYIADIYDVKGDGETAKPFGRIFYTKDASLVFYAYDLDKRTRRNKLASFQVWGSGDDQPDVSLGLFSRDGKQKCWILHFNDKKTLARLNKVFVTVEPPGGSNKPTGKQILMAYLRIHPNHP